jgi:hypothetical protein
MLFKFKRIFSLIFILTFLWTSVLVQFTWTVEVTQDTLLEDLYKTEMAIYGIATAEKPLVERLEYLEKELVGRTMPGTIASRVKQLKDFIIAGTPEEPSVVFKINASQWILEAKITSEPLSIKIDNLEMALFGKTSTEVLAMKAENIFSLCFKESKPQVEEVMVPAGTLVPVSFLSSLSSKDNKTGETFNFQIAENVFVENKLVVPKHSEGVGEIIKAKKATILSRSGKLELEFTPISALDGTSLSLIFGEEAQKENNRVAIALGVGIVGLIVLSNPIGLIAGALIPGKNVKIEQGTQIFLQVKEDTKVIALVQ